MKIHEIKGFIQSTYLIEDKEKLLLLDSGCRCDVQKIHNEINRLSPAQLEFIALSHNHPDHCGGATQLQSMYQCQTAGPKGLTEWYSGIQGTLTYWIDIALTYYVAYRKKKNLFKNVIFNSQVHLDTTANHASHLELFSDWISYFTPGHTPLDTCFFHLPTRTLYVGDLLILIRQKLIRPYPIYEPENYIQSLQFIKNLNPKTLLLAHGGIYHPGPDFNYTLDQLCRFTSKVPRTHHILLKILLNKLTRKKRPIRHKK